MKKNIKTAFTVVLLVIAVFALSCCKKETPYIYIKDDTITLEVGKTAELNVEKSKIKDKIAYYTDNPGVVSIDGDGIITGLSEGRAIVEVSADGYTDSCNVNVVSSASSAQTAFPVLLLSQNDVYLNEGDEFFVMPRLICDGKALKTEFSCGSSDVSLGTAEVSDGKIKISALNCGKFDVTVTCEYENTVFEDSVSVNVVRDAALTLSRNSVEFNLLHGKDGKFAEKTVLVNIEEMRLDGAAYGGAVTVSAKDSSANGWLKYEYIANAIKITALGIGETALTVSITDGSETFASVITVKSYTQIGITGASHNLTAATVGARTANVFGISVAKVNDSFSFTPDYVDMLKNEGVKAVKVWLSGITVAVQPDGTLPTGTYEWQTSPQNGWEALHMRNIRYGTANKYSNNPRYSYWDNVLTPDDLLRFGVKFVGNTKLSGYIYVETFVGNYPAISGREFTQRKIQLGQGDSATAYSVSFAHSDCAHGSGEASTNCPYNKGFMISGAYIADLKAQGAEKVKIMYKSDGQLDLRIGYNGDEAACSGNGWLSAASDFAEMRLTNVALSIDTAEISLETLTDLHFCVPVNAGTFPTFFEFYVVAV